MFDTDWLQILITGIIFLLVVAAIYCIYTFGLIAAGIISLIILFAYILYKILF